MADLQNSREVRDKIKELQRKQKEYFSHRVHETQQKILVLPTDSLEKKRLELALESDKETLKTMERIESNISQSRGTLAEMITFYEEQAKLYSSEATKFMD